MIFFKKNNLIFKKLKFKKNTKCQNKIKYKNMCILLVNTKEKKILKR
jgi:hypothetical protein